MNEAFIIRKEQPNGDACRMFREEMRNELRPYLTTIAKLPAEARPAELPIDAVFSVARSQREDVLLGSLALIPLQPDSILSRGLPMGVKAAEVKRMIVRQEYRQHGVGRKLLEAIEEVARVETGVQLVVLETLHSMDYALQFYEKSGYVRRSVFGAYNAADSQCYEKYLTNSGR